jgi:subtilisin family serine protease
MVGIIDTGCDYSHRDLIGQVEVADAISEHVAGDQLEDLVGHGTFVTSQVVAHKDGKGVVGAAPGAKAYNVRVLYGNSADFLRRNIEQDLADAIDMCHDEGCGVISMSLGGPDKPDWVGIAVRKAVANGVIVVAAAGNERLVGSPYASYPASFRDVISVAAANRDDLPAWFSTIGVEGHDPIQQPEVAIAGREYYWGCLPYGMYGAMIGTSMSTPVLAAVALLWRQARKQGGTLPRGDGVTDAFRKWLRRVSDDVNRNGWDPELGYGTLLLDDDELGNFGQ